MSLSQRSRAAELFDAVCDLAPEERDARLARECVDDPDLLAEVRRLLAFDQQSMAFLSEAEVEAGRARLDRLLDTAASPGDEREASWIGPYRVLRRLGEGGMGIVYEAEQESPRRRVALKIMRPHLATPTRLARFRQEVELLGRLQHPGIAQVHDSGTFDLGQGPQPYFVLEMVDGEDLTRHAQRRRLPAAARLELLARVCDGVQHAHERGVIHRDLKPENILVDARGQPKILDFGVARAAEGSTMLNTLLTEDGDLLGTIAYMAPEQVRGELDGITPRTDVYALGVIAFQLLAQRLPHDVVGLPLTAAVGLVLEREPPRLGELRPELAGDVETIVGKALAKEPERRYASADEMARDLRAHLAHRPIKARPPSLAYRVAKFARRHRALVLGTSATLITLTLGLVAALILADREGQQRLRAERGLRRAAGQLMSAAQDHLDRGDVWKAARLHRDVDGSQRGWPWEFQARVLPRLLPAHQDSTHWLDSDHLLGGDPVLGLEVVDILRRTSRPAAPGLDVRRLLGHTGALLGSGEFVEVDWLTGTVGRRFAPRSMHPLLTNTAPVVTPDGSLLSSGLTTGDPVWLTCLDGREQWRVPAERGSVALTPDLSTAILHTWTGRLVLRDVASGSLLGEVAGLLPIDTPRHRFTPDGRSLIVLLADGRHMARVDLDELTLHPLPGPLPVASEFDLSPDGRLLAFAPGDGPLSVCDVATGEVLRQEHHFDAPGRPGDDKPAFSPDGRALAIAAEDLGTLLIDLGEAPRNGAGLGGGDDPRALTYTGHAGHWVYHLAVSPDGHLAASSAPGQREVHVWDVDTGETLLRLERAVDEEPGLSDRARLLAFSPDGAALVMETPMPDSPGTELVTWELLDGALRSEPLGPGGDASQARAVVRLEELFGEQGGRLGRSAHKPAGQPARRLVEAAAPDPQGDPAWLVVLPQDRHHAGLALSPDGRRAAVSKPRIVTVHELPSGSTVARHYLHAHGLAWSPDGALLAVGGQDGRIHLFDGRLDVPLLDVPAHDDYVFSLVWTPDGSRLLSASGDGTVRVWDARPRAERVAAAARRAARLEALRDASSADLRARWAAADTAQRGELLRVLLERR